MKLTKEMIEAYDPCSGGLDWYLKYGSDDLLDTLLKVNKVSLIPPILEQLKTIHSESLSSMSICFFANP
jgi:hypothetical protein